MLQDERTLRRLLDLPERLFTDAGKQTTPYAAGLMREEALAIGILLTCPIRVGNLAGLHLVTIFTGPATAACSWPWSRTR